MAEFGLKKSFHIDHGELDGLSPQMCFVLGYELAQLDWMLRDEFVNIDDWSMTVHVENRERIEEACRDAKRPFTLTWLEGDVSESWLLLKVTP